MNPIDIVAFLFVILATFVLNEWHMSFDREENSNTDMFLSCSLITVIICIFTLKRESKDVALSRHQTNEWKGFMQIIIILYHYYRAKYVYNEMRVFVSSYLWLSGFGNFVYFRKVNDFSCTRALSMLIRMNLLTVAIMIANNTTPMLYYIVPLHNVAYILVCTVCFFIKTSGNSPLILIASLLCIVVAFECFHLPLGHEVQFRFGLDKYSVWWGMFYGYIHQRIRHGLKSGCVGLSMILVWYIMWGHIPDKYTYNRLHPYVSILPIAGYVLVRNCHPVLRQTYSSAMAWVGTLTLETYVLQFHILMCRNAKHILVLVPNFPVLNFILTGSLFVCTAFFVRKVTNNIQKNIICKVKKVKSS